MKKYTYDPDCIVWVYFFIVLFIVNFGIMIWVSVSKKSWIVELRKTLLFGVLYPVFGIIMGYMCGLFASMYLSGFRVIHYLLGLENPPWK